MSAFGIIAYLPHQVTLTLYVSIFHAKSIAWKTGCFYGTAWVEMSGFGQWLSANGQKHGQIIGE
jgi:hypothetical protein